jgi:RNA polymerase sigma factor (sigma-70 family)
MRQCPHCAAWLSAREARTHLCEPLLAIRRRRAIEDALARHLGWARSIAESVARRAPSGVAVEDLRQVAAMALIRRVPEFDRRRGVPLRGYLYEYVRGACLMLCRRLCGHNDLPEEVVASGLGPDSRLCRCEAAELLVGLLDELPVRQSQIVMLHYFCGLGLAEVGRRLGISETWTIIQHGRAKAGLRRLLEAQGIHSVGGML